MLLLDEPTAGVDPKARRDFWDEIHRLAAGGMTVLVTTHYMDEAERCHEIIFIANGKRITQGTVSEVIAHAGLTTWVARGEGLEDVQHALTDNPAISTVAPFGDSLHVSGTDAEALAAATAVYRARKDQQWELTEPSMEDAFIQYMALSSAHQDADAQPARKKGAIP